MTRREALERLAAAALAATALVERGSAQGALELTALSERLALISGAGANVTVLIAPEELLLVDGGSAEHAGELARLLEEHWPGRPVRTLFNTNWRGEHTGLNADVIATGGRILAHVNTKLWMGADFFVEWESLRHERRPAAQLPNDAFYKGGQIEVGGARVAYGHLPRAHTDGDIYVHFPDDDVLVAGDLLAVGAYPVVDYVTGGWIGGMSDATRALLDLSKADTRIVPAHGGVQPRAALEAQLGLCTTVMDSVAATYRTGGSLEDFIAANPVAGHEQGRGDARLFLSLVYEGAYGHIRQLGGII